MRFLHKSNIAQIEEHLENPNIGGRSKKSAHDHLFVLHSVLKECMYGKNRIPCDFVFKDVRQAFDSLWGKKTYLDLYANGVKNQTINLLYEINKEATIKIKTPVGVSDDAKIYEKTMQGENFSSILCTSTFNGIIKKCPIDPYYC